MHAKYTEEGQQTTEMLVKTQQRTIFMRTKTDFKEGNSQDLILLLHVFGVKHVYTDDLIDLFRD